ncbi:hypothetical protein I3843_13G004200 [Carya illinoinensis]|nr:hypothetical protein I3843_13G004200 [Carya illinoinensis]KAG7948331.1 hypothetical protein I3843_13G004200 [Carya illinoinensis]
MQPPSATRIASAPPTIVVLRLQPPRPWIMENFQFLLSNQVLLTTSEWDDCKQLLARYTEVK